MDAYVAAYETDPVSAFGGIIAFNRSLDRETAQKIIEQQFVEVILAPDLEEGVLSTTEAKPGVRVLVTGEQTSRPAQLELKRVSGGLLVQDSDTGTVKPDQLNVVSRRKPGTGELKDMLFAWQVVKYVKSNAIVYARDNRTVGIGAGQMSRVYSARIAAIKAADAGLEVAGAVMASDAFFPFRDGIDSAAESGSRAVIQPGGSVRDSEGVAEISAFVNPLMIWLWIGAGVYIAGGLVVFAPVQAPATQRRELPASGATGPLEGA